MIEHDSHTPVRILIVDDTPEDRVAYKRLLQSARRAGSDSQKFEVMEADSASEGLEVVKTWAPDCVLLDYRLPDMNGIEFLGELASQAGYGGLPVVMLTGQGDETVARDAMKCGAQDYLVKGQLTSDTLQEAIYNAVEMCSLRRMVERQRRQLQRTNQELERYARVVAHDLEAPLKGIRLGLDKLQKQASHVLDADSAAFVAEAIESGGRMAVLIRDLLEYSRATSKPAPFTRVDMQKVAETAVGNLKEPIRSTQAKVTFGKLPAIMGDEYRLLQLLQNLISNAIKYRDSSRAPEIRTTSEQESDDVWRFAVADNGMGIDPAHAQRIFDPFTRLHPASEIEGTGLGLAICRSVVESHNGTVWVESKPGEGSVFYFTLPAGHTSEVVTEPSAPARVATSN